MTGSEGVVVEQSDGRLITRDSIGSDAAIHSFDERDIGTNSEKGAIEIEPETLAGSTTVMISLTSDDDREFTVAFKVLDGEGDTLFTVVPPRFDRVTEIWGQFPVLHPFMEVSVNDNLRAENRISGGISFRTGDSDAMTDYGVSGVKSDQVTADTAGDVGSTLPLTTLATAVPRGTEVAVKALVGNAGPVYVGDINNVTTDNGAELPAGSSVSLQVSAVEELGMIAENQGDGVSWIVEVPT